jgi:phosphoribosyl 1,2-cyclic phosphodiesterase
MKMFPIRSSSSGNCTAIEVGDTVILIDCGITLKALKQAIGDLQRIKAVFITHEHSDHISGVGPLSRKITCPFYINEQSLKKKEAHFADVVNLNNLTSGQEVLVDACVAVNAFTTKHDSAYSVGFVITVVGHEKQKLGYVTDTGFITPMMAHALKECSAIFIEADYDDELLNECDQYDEFLKDRIRSNFGHLSNKQMLEFITQHLKIEDLEFVVVGHLSGRTNSPERVQSLLEAQFPEHIEKFHIAPLTEALHWEIGE